MIWVCAFFFFLVGILIGLPVADRYNYMLARDYWRCTQWNLPDPQRDGPDGEPICIEYSRVEGPK